MFKGRGLQWRLMLVLLAGLLFVGQVSHGVQESMVRSITILYTNDEHGWMETQETRDVLLDPRARDLGFAWYQESSGKIWWTLITGQPRGGRPAS